MKSDFFLRKERFKILVSFFRNHVLGIYFLCVCLAGGESESEVEEEDDDDGGKFGRNGSPKRSEIGRRCC